MKKINYLFIFILGLIYHSCCHMKGCPEELTSIELSNFSISELDTICVKKYAKNSNFLKAEDSIFAQFYEDDSTYKIPLDGRDSNGAAIVYSYDKDYAVYLNGLKKTYKITNITTKDEKCNTCYPIGYTTYRKMDFYNINGALQTATKFHYNQLIIKK